jgi:hypothetical protein
MTVVIARRFHGPPDSGNGGYVCGLVAAAIADAVDGAAEITLRSPPPLETPLELATTPGGAVLRAGDAVVAEGKAAPLVLDVVAPVSLDDATAAARGCPGFAWHPFPSCFVCGPARADGDGLRIFPGPIAGRDIAAAPWTPHPSLADGSDTVRPEHLWAALDCPSYFGMQAVSPARVTALLGRLAARIHRLPRVGEPCVAAGWLLGRDGRKIHAATAVFTADGELLGASRATWIETQR